MIDFTDEGVIEWFDWVVKKHPEIIRDSLILRTDLTTSGLQKVMNGDLEITARPGKPYITKKVIDWDAWYLYYELSQLAGFKIGYSDIALLTNRKQNTVMREFKSRGITPTILPDK